MLIVDSMRHLCVMNLIIGGGGEGGGVKTSFLEVYYYNVKQQFKSEIIS